MLKMIDEWKPCNNLMAKIRSCETIKRVNTSEITRLIDKDMMPINNGILIFGNTKLSYEFSIYCRDVFEDLTESVPCKFNDMSAFTIVWYLMKGKCLLYNEFFRDRQDCYQYNGELIYDQPNYTCYHYYLEKYQDNREILIMCRNMIERYQNGKLSKPNQIKLMSEMVGSIF
jgi:hypothetical protein